MTIRVRRFGSTRARLDAQGIELSGIEDPRFRRWEWSEIGGVIGFAGLAPELILVPLVDGRRRRALEKTIPVTGHRLLVRDRQIMEMFTLRFRPGTRPKISEVERYIRAAAPHLDWNLDQKRG
ncbi:hypothetical protein [Gordonia sp. FQ]|uniref:hypothetical protein n=1 Tax=Gordonia sp. FQ TaxID=3446634 RepID=UPI003F83F858